MIDQEILGHCVQWYWDVLFWSKEGERGFLSEGILPARLYNQWNNISSTSFSKNAKYIFLALDPHSPKKKGNLIKRKTTWKHVEQYYFQLWSSFSQWHFPPPQWWPAKFWSIFHPPFISFFPTKAHFEFRIDYPKAVIDTFALLSMSFALQEVHCNAPKDVPDQQILPV